MTELDYHNMCDLPLKVVLYIDGDCSTCLLKIGFWKEFVSEMNKQKLFDFSVVVYAFSSFEENMRSYLKEEWNGLYQWQFDKNKSFITKNELYDIRLQTVLLDADNNVILIGDPLLNPTLRQLYSKTIKSLL
ncbi:MAG: hypothetical protein PHD11_08625 [Bacteroidales bacterium]|nr:hypothetical protein [Bacteroidales bacterium]MDD4671241.1 hypothetical protein [Bacteroidales bacterium]